MTRVAAASFAGRRVLVTGSAGFLGSHLVCALSAAGAETHAIVRSAGARAASARPPVDLRNVHTHICDLRDGETLADIVRAVDPQHVFHLAAYGTTSTQQDEARMLDVSVDGTRNLWLALEGRAARFVQTGTCAEYGAVRGPIAETQVCRPRWPYPAAIHAAVTWSQARGFETGREVVILRPFGSFGPGDRAERLIPYVIARLVSGARAVVSSGGQVRDYSYVDDHITAMLLAGGQPLPDPVAVYNVGSGRPITVRQLLDGVAREIGDGAIDRIDFDARPIASHEPPEMYADISAIVRDLGYIPAQDLSDGIRRTVASYLDQPSANTAG